MIRTIILLLAFMFIALPGQAQSISDLQAELESLSKKIDYYTSDSVSLKEKEDYVEKILDLQTKLKELEKQQEAANAEDAANEETGPVERHAPLLILSEVQYAGKQGKSYGFDGYMVDHCISKDCKKYGRMLRVVKFADYPETIRLGESFTVTVSNRSRNRFPDFHNNCYMDDGRREAKIPARLFAVIDNLNVEAEGTESLAPYCFQLEKKKKLWKEGYSAWSSQETLTATYKFKLKDIDYLSGKNPMPQYYNYVVESAETSGTFQGDDPKGKTFKIGAFSRNEHFDEDGYYLGDIDQGDLLTIRVGSEATPMALIYRLAKAGDAPPVLDEVKVPKDMALQPEDMMQALAEADRQDGNEGKSLQDMINPDAPDIAGLMAQWMIFAAPPENVTEGASFKYEEWGRVYGTAANGAVIKKPERKPDDAGVQTYGRYLWARASKLDSVDHCTLKEYVEKKGQDLGECKGRYKASVKKEVKKQEPVKTVQKTEPPKKAAPVKKAPAAQPKTSKPKLHMNASNLQSLSVKAFRSSEYVLMEKYTDDYGFDVSTGIVTNTNGVYVSGRQFKRTGEKYYTGNLGMYWARAEQDVPRLKDYVKGFSDGVGEYSAGYQFWSPDRHALVYITTGTSVTRQQVRELGEAALRYIEPYALPK